MKQRNISLHKKSPEAIKKIADGILSLSQSLPEPVFLSMRDKFCFDLKRSYDKMPDTIAGVVIVTPEDNYHPTDESMFDRRENIPSVDSADVPSTEYGVQVVPGFENEEKTRVLELAKMMGCAWALEISRRQSS